MTPENLKKLRLRTELSPQQAADLVHISKRSWSRYEKGDRDVPEGIVHLFCLLANIDYPLQPEIISIYDGEKKLCDVTTDGLKIVEGVMKNDNNL